MKPGRSALKIRRSVKVDLSWRVWSLIVGFFILIGFVGLSFAYNANGVGGNPAIMGHSADEISGIGIPTGADYVIETWKSADGSSWYRKYKSGWIEQGGFNNGDSSTSAQNILLTFPIRMSEIVDFSASPIFYSSTTTYGQTINYINFTSENATVRIMKDVYTNSGYSTLAKFYWSVKGKI